MSDFEEIRAWDGRLVRRTRVIPPRPRRPRRRGGLNIERMRLAPSRGVTEVSETVPEDVLSDPDQAHRVTQRIGRRLDTRGDVMVDLYAERDIFTRTVKVTGTVRPRRP